MIASRRYADGDWWLRVGRWTVGTRVEPAYISLSEREGRLRVWRFRRWSATHMRKSFR